MKTPPAHVLARLDDIIVGQEEAKDGGGTPPRHVLLQNCDDDDDDAAFGIESSASSFSTRPQGDDRSDDTAAPEPTRKVQRCTAKTTTNHRAPVVGPDPARAPTETSSKYWGVTWQQSSKLWQAQYTDANNATQYLGVFRTQEAAAHRVNAAIETLPAHVQRRRRKNEIDAATGKLVPLKKSVAPGHGPRCHRYREKRNRSYSTRARRPRRAVSFDEFQPDDEDGWD